MSWSYCAFLCVFIFIQFSGEFSSRDDSCISCPLSFLASAAVARGEGDSVGAGGGEGGTDGGGGCAGLDGDGDRAGKLVHLIFGHFLIVACFRRRLAAGSWCVLLCTLVTCCSLGWWCC